MRKPVLSLRVFALAGLLTFAARVLSAVDGAPDPAFNGNGRAVVDVGPDARPKAVAVQADGKVVVVGSVKVPAASDPGNTAFVVVRWNADGTRDTTFGPSHSGVVTVEFDLGPVGWRQDGASSVGIQADGKIVVAGWARSSESQQVAAVARLTALGNLDNDFGGDGKVSFAQFGFTSACAVLVRRDGKILLTPTSYSPDLVLLQLDDEGNPDMSFGFGGQTEPWSCGSSCGELHSTVEMPDGGLLTLATNGSGDQVVLLRFLGESGPGELDDGFGNSGVATFTPPGFSSLYLLGMALGHDGRVVVWVEQQGAPWNTALLRLRGDQPDAAFGNGGWLPFLFKPPTSATTGTPTSLALQDDGKLLLAGTAIVDGSWNFVVTRRAANGAVDPTFSGGWAPLAFDVGGGLTDFVTAMTLAAGRAAVAGSAETSSGWLFAAGRLDNALISRDGFESGSTWFWRSSPQ
jgi:uncharacterized delta-60 repeat protein